MGIVFDMVGGAIGASSSVGLIALGYATYKQTSKHNREEDVKAQNKQDTDDAVALAGAVNDISWMRNQLGEKPNSGGAMEQVLTGQRNMERKIDSFAAEFTKHLAWHIEKNGR